MKKAFPSQAETMNRTGSPAYVAACRRQAAELRAQAFRLIRQADELETRAFRMSQGAQAEKAAFKAAKAA
jgi:hypothetical protein